MRLLVTSDVQVAAADATRLVVVVVGVQRTPSSAPDMITCWMPAVVVGECAFLPLRFTATTVVATVVAVAVGTNYLAARRRPFSVLYTRARARTLHSTTVDAVAAAGEFFFFLLLFSLSLSSLSLTLSLALPLCLTVSLPFRYSLLFSARTPRHRPGTRKPAHTRPEKGTRRRWQTPDGTLSARPAAVAAAAAVVVVVVDHAAAAAAAAAGRWIVAIFERGETDNADAHGRWDYFLRTRAHDRSEDGALGELGQSGWCTRIILYFNILFVYNDII